MSALGNLVENAVKYTEPGSSVQVRVRVDGSWVEFMVADHGIGIPARDHDRIFERFYRVDKARSRDTGGTGLGLSIVRHVADNHGGEVQVSSQEGEGSTFVLRIPLRPASHRPTQRAPEPRTRHVREERRERPDSAGRRGRAELRRGPPVGLKREGFIVEVAMDGSRRSSASTSSSPTSCCST